MTVVKELCVCLWLLSLPVTCSSSWKEEDLRKRDREKNKKRSRATMMMMGKELRERKEIKAWETRWKRDEDQGDEEDLLHSFPSNISFHDYLIPLDSLWQDLMLLLQMISLLSVSNLDSSSSLTDYPVGLSLYLHHHQEQQHHSLSSTLFIPSQDNQHHYPCHDYYTPSTPSSSFQKNTCSFFSWQHLLFQTVFL